jgi:glycine/D-amino acid oxidase-like deaminating enzyme
MYSPRGVLMLAHNIHDIQVFKRHVHANRLAGIDNEWLSAAMSVERTTCASPALRNSSSGRSSSQ